jgi:beta-lactam-binding protein with PASTA domain
MPGAAGAATRSGPAWPAPGEAPTRQGPTGWPADGNGATRLPPAGAPSLRPRPTTGRTPKPRATRSKERRRGGWLAALLVLGLLAVGLATRAGGLLGGPVRVPTVVGEEVADATRSLQSRGLRVRVGEPVPSERVHEGLVATQSVAGGEAVSRRTTVELRPSLGILVPDLVGRPAASARTSLQDLAIRFRQEPATSLTVAHDRIVGTRPPAGTALKDDQVIVLRVSVGKPKVQVPQVAGRRFEVAREMLAAAHLDAARRAEFHDFVPAGRVVGTDPAAGATATWGSKVTVVVSKGPDLVVVPDVVGLTKRQAERRLRAAGLNWSYSFFGIGSRVTEQRPKAGEKARRGSHVQLMLNVL